MPLGRNSSRSTISQVLKRQLLVLALFGRDRPQRLKHQVVREGVVCLYEAALEFSFEKDTSCSAARFHFKVQRQSVYASTQRESQSESQSERQS